MKALYCSHTGLPLLHGLELLARYCLDTKHVTFLTIQFWLYGMDLLRANDRVD